MYQSVVGLLLVLLMPNHYRVLLQHPPHGTV